MCCLRLYVYCESRKPAHLLSRLQHEISAHFPTGKIESFSCQQSTDVNMASGCAQVYLLQTIYWPRHTVCRSHNTVLAGWRIRSRKPCKLMRRLQQKEGIHQTVW